MPPEFTELKEIVGYAMQQLYNWLNDHVRELDMHPAEMRLEWQANATYIGLSLVGHSSCRCGRQLCPRQHSLEAHAESGLELEAFIKRAVVGPAGYLTNSIVKGMAFPYLTFHGLRKASVEFKRCRGCEIMYEGGSCPKCQTSFDPSKTEVVGREWLIKEGVYLRILRWGCEYTRQQETEVENGAHYYQQEKCRSIPIAERLEPRYRVIHGDGHDHCPWQECPNYGTRHPQRGTTLWIQARFVNADITPTLFPTEFVECLGEGIQMVLEGLDDTDVERLYRLNEDEVVIADILLVDGVSASRLKKAVPELADEEVSALLQIRPHILAAVRQALAERGIDEGSIEDYLRSQSETAVTEV